MLTRYKITTCNTQTTVFRPKALRTTFPHTFPSD